MARKVLALALLLTACAISPAATPTATPQPTISSTASPTPMAGVGLSWRPVPIIAPMDRGGFMEAVTFGGPGAVAVGGGICEFDANFVPTACFGSIYTRQETGPWLRVEETAALSLGVGFESGPSIGLIDVASGRQGLVAIGYVSDPTYGVGIWHSADGANWERIEPGAEFADGRPAAVAAGEGGFVIVGAVVTPGAPHAAAWSSPDGRTWTRSRDGPEMDIGPYFETGETPGTGGMLDVAAAGPGFVAVGRALRQEGGSAPAAWTSVDGDTWVRTDKGLDLGDADGLLSSVTAGGHGVVAVGLICQRCFNVAGGALVAVSGDGAAWTTQTIDGSAPLVQVAADGGPILAVGWLNQFDADPRADLQLWRSDDGVTWHRVLGLPSIPDALVYRSADIVVAPDRAVIVGWAEVSGEDGPIRAFAYHSP